MTLTRLLVVALSSLAAAVLFIGADDPPARVVIPFDFESTFDDGRYGRIVGEMLWTKLSKEQGLILPETIQDVRDACQRARFRPGPDTPLDRLKTFVRDEQAGDAAIWGKVERVPGNEFDVYDLWIKVADFTSTPPRVLFETKVRTRTVSEIPHLYARRAIDALMGRPEMAVAAAPSEAAPAVGPSLVRGDFEHGDPSPEGWDPLSPHVSWVSEEGAPRPNRIVRFQQDEAVAGTTGVLYYSAPFPVEPGATYRFSCRFRTSGSAVKVFIKAYDALPTRFPGGNPSATERREVYRSQQNLVGDPGAWHTHTQDFTPSSPKFTPRQARVMLYAYWPAGTTDFDDVSVQRVAKAAPEPAP